MSWRQRSGGAACRCATSCPLQRARLAHRGEGSIPSPAVTLLTRGTSGWCPALRLCLGALGVAGSGEATASRHPLATGGPCIGRRHRRDAQGPPGARSVLQGDPSSGAWCPGPGGPHAPFCSAVHAPSLSAPFPFPSPALGSDAICVVLTPGPGPGALCPSAPAWAAPGTVLALPSTGSHLQSRAREPQPPVKKLATRGRG